MQGPIAEFLADVKASKADNTARNRRADLKRFDAWLAENDIDALEAEPRHVHQWLRAEQGKYAPGTVQSRYDSVKLLYDFLADLRGDVAEHPVEDLKRREFTNGNGSKKHGGDELSYVTAAEVDKLAGNVPNPKVRNELLVRLLFQTGLRRGEVTLVELDNIDRENRSIRVYAPKTDDWRTVFYQPSLDFLLDRWVEAYRQKHGTADRSPYLFPTRQSEKLRPQQVNRVARTAAENAGIQEVLFRDADGRPHYRVTAHALRHGHAVHSLKSGIDIRTLAEHMGHENIETTMQYLRIVERDVKDAYEAVTW